MARPDRWSGDVGTAGPMCRSEANDGKMLNDDYRHRINQNYHWKLLTKDLKMFAGGFRGQLGMFMPRIMSSTNILHSMCGRAVCELA